MSIYRTTRKVAELAGYTVRTDVYPWLAFRGDWESPDEMYECWTDEETRLMDELEKAREQLRAIIPQSSRNVVYLKPKLAVVHDEPEAEEAGKGYVNQD